MRHVRSLLYALVLAPAVWTLSGVAFTQDLTGRARTEGTIEALVGFLLLLLAGAAYAILLLPRFSPVGPVAAGVVFLVVSIWALIDANSVDGLAPTALNKPGFDLTLPADGLAVLLAVPLLCTALSARRWREPRSSPDMVAPGAFVWPFARPAQPGTLVVPGVTGVPTADATQIITSGTPGASSGASDASDRTQVISNPAAGDTTQLVSPAAAGGTDAGGEPDTVAVDREPATEAVDSEPVTLPIAAAESAPEPPTEQIDAEPATEPIDAKTEAISTEPATEHVGAEPVTQPVTSEADTEPETQAVPADSPPKTIPSDDDRTQAITLPPDDDRTQAITPPPPGNTGEPGSPGNPGAKPVAHGDPGAKTVAHGDAGEQTQVISPATADDDPGERTQVINPGEKTQASSAPTENIDVLSARRPESRTAGSVTTGTVQPPGDTTEVLSIPVSDSVPGERTTVTTPTPADNGDEPTMMVLGVGETTRSMTVTGSERPADEASDDTTRPPTHPKPTDKNT